VSDLERFAWFASIVTLVGAIGVYLTTIIH
jgi:hypothetical protein